MNHIYKIILVCITVSLFSLSGINAQMCRGYAETCPNPPTQFKNNSVVRSFELTPNKTIKIRQILYGATSYHFSVCGDKELGNIRLRLLTDDEDQMLLYDNASANYAPTQSFDIINSIKVIIEISTPNYSDSQTAKCAGLNISSFKTGEI